jgi:hypothetical protein
MVSTAMTEVTGSRTTLGLEHQFHLFMARNWLAIGILEEARREFQSLPPEIQAHPEAESLRRRLFSRRQNDEGDDK